MRKSIAVALVSLMLGGCCESAQGQPVYPLLPMWASSQCWSGRAWKRCQEERKALGVTHEGYFVN
jgi:hypothetical protein